MCNVWHKILKNQNLQLKKLYNSQKMDHNIIRNEVTILYVLLECFKWISMYFKANNAINAYNIDSL